MLKSSVIIFFLLVSISVKAQLYSSAFHAQWSILTPISDKDYIGKTSAAGMRFGFSKFVSDRFGFGFEGGYASLADYIPRATYYDQGSAYTTDFHNYLTYYTVMASGQYFFRKEKSFCHTHHWQWVLDLAIIRNIIMYMRVMILRLVLL